MVLNIDANLEEKLICAFKNDMKNLADFRSQAEKQQFHFRKQNGRTNTLGINE